MTKKIIPVLIPSIGIVMFMFSQWIMKSASIFGISSDLIGGLVVGTGIGMMLALLWHYTSKNKTN